MTRMDQALRRCVGRYRMALLARTVLHAGLGVGIVAAILWRMSRAGGAWRLVETWLALGIVLGIAGLAWWTRRHWVSSRTAVQALDDTLHLEQRLVTASEFARELEQPALYPVLIEDTIGRLMSVNRRRPRVLDRTSAVLALVLLLLLVPWTIGRRGIHLAQLPGQTPQASPQPPESPTPQPPQPDASRQPRPAQPQGAGSQERGQPDSSRQPRPDDGRGQQEQPQPSDQSSSGQPQDSRGQSGEQREKSGADGEGAKDRDAASDRQSGSQQDAQRPGASDGKEGSEGHDEQRSGSGESQAQQDTGGEQDGQSGQPSQSPSGEAGSEGRGQQQQASAGQGTKTAGAVSGGSSASQQALKSDIQALLKELQGQLRQMQGQLAAQDTDRSHPQAGTGTDPNLYGGAESLSPPQGPESSVPLQLETDEAPSRTTRRGSGVGEASGDVASSAPQLSNEHAELSDAPREETSSRRRAVPPEYQEVFEQLSEQPATSSGAATP